MTATCPRCGHGLVGSTGFVQWCESCDWNVDPLVAKDLSEPRRSKLDAVEVALAERLHRRFLEKRPTRPPVTAASVALWVLCTAVVLFHFALIACGVLIMMTSSSRVFSAVIAVPLVAAGLLPFLPRRRHRSGVVLPRAEFPHMHELVDAVGAAVGVRRVRTIRLDGEFNASAARSFRGHVLTVGLPLWLALEPDERVFVVAHELAHFRNGDPVRGRLPWLALSGLDEWLIALHVSGATGSLARQHGLLTRMVALPIVSTRALISRLSFTASQQAEYFADRLAAGAAGVEPGIRSLSTLHSGFNTFALAFQRWRVVGTLWPSVHELFASLPESERARRSRAAELAVRVVPGRTHPPTGYRIDVLRSQSELSDPALVSLATTLDSGLAAAGVELEEQMRTGMSK